MAPLTPQGELVVLPLLFAGLGRKKGIDHLSVLLQ